MCFVFHTGAIPFNEVTQEVERVHGLLFVLEEREPVEPMGKNLVDVNALRSKPHDLSYGGDAVFRGVDVLLDAGVS